MTSSTILTIATMIAINTVISRLRHVVMRQRVWGALTRATDSRFSHLAGPLNTRMPQAPSLMKGRNFFKAQISGDA